jgi:hypothetical protein
MAMDVTCRFIALVHWCALGPSKAKHGRARAKFVEVVEGKDRLLHRDFRSEDVGGIDHPHGFTPPRNDCSWGFNRRPRIGLLQEAIA